MELRACLFLNRFTRNLCVMYASPSCELILDIDPDDLLGKPLLLYIRADDLASFVEQADLAKSTATVRHLRFWFQSPNCPQEIPLEAGTRAYHAPLLNTYVGSINSIRSLDNEQTRIRPLASFHEDENAIDGSKAQDMIRPVHTQDSEVETILVEGFEAIELVPDRKKFIKREKDIEEGGHLYEDDNFGEDQGITTIDEPIEEIQMPYSIRRYRREE
ncbi:hypothetical protein BGX20_003778 [Mortierella sp. AD010]|nr:hypothetical protein BGX20_003778 [Mortierella sp. AD010]